MKNIFIVLALVLALTVAAGLGLVAMGGTEQNGVTNTDLDNRACAGLAGAENSLCYRVEELENHFHNRERWFGKLAVQTATDWADDNLSPYRAISGNGVYGADPNDEAQVLGTADTPVIAGKTKYDMHRIAITASSSTSVWKLRVVYGTGTMADAVAAGQYSTVMVRYDPAIGENSNANIEIMIPRLTSGTYKVWVQGKNATDNATIDFFVGLHEYTF